MAKVAKLFQSLPEKRRAVIATWLRARIEELNVESETVDAEQGICFRSDLAWIEAQLEGFRRSVQSELKVTTELDPAIKAWCNWYSAKLGRINNGSKEDYTGYEQDLFEAFGCRTFDTEE